MVLLEAMFETEDPFAEKAFNTVRWWQFFRAKARAILKKNNSVYFDKIGNAPEPVAKASNAANWPLPSFLIRTPSTKVSDEQRLAMKRKLEIIIEKTVLEAPLVSGLMFPYRGVDPETLAAEDLNADIVSAEGRAIVPYSEDVVAALKNQGIDESIVALLGPPLKTPVEDEETHDRVLELEKRIVDANNELDNARTEIEKLQAQIKQLEQISSKSFQNQAENTKLKREIEELKHEINVVQEDRDSAIQETFNVSNGRIRQYSHTLKDLLIDPDVQTEAWKSLEEVDIANRKLLTLYLTTTLRAIEYAPTKREPAGLKLAPEHLTMLAEWTSSLLSKIPTARTADVLDDKWSPVDLSDYPVFRILREYEFIDTLLGCIDDPEYAHKDGENPLLPPERLWYLFFDIAKMSIYSDDDHPHPQSFSAKESLTIWIEKSKTLSSRNVMSAMYTEFVRPVVEYDPFYINIKLSPLHITTFRHLYNTLHGIVDIDLQPNVSMAPLDWYLINHKKFRRKLVGAGDEVLRPRKLEDGDLEAGPATAPNKYLSETPALGSHKMLSPAKSHMEALLILRELAAGFAEPISVGGLSPEQKNYVNAYTTLLATDYLITSIARLEMVHAIYYRTSPPTNTLKALLYSEFVATNNLNPVSVRASAE